MKKTYKETIVIPADQLPKDVYNTFKEWKTTFGYKTKKNKEESAAKLDAHSAACESAGLDFEAVGVIMFNVKF